MRDAALQAPDLPSERTNHALFKLEIAKKRRWLHQFDGLANGLSYRKATVFRSRACGFSSCSAGVVGVEASVEVLHKPDPTSRKAGPAVGAGPTGGGRPGGHPVGQDPGDRQVASDGAPLV